MAAERAEDAALSGEEVDLAVEQLEESKAGPGKRSTWGPPAATVGPRAKLRQLWVPGVF